MFAQDKRRLAKRDGDLSLKALRERGVKPEKVIGMCAHSAGLLQGAEPISARALVAAFDLKHVARADLTLPEPIA